MEYKMQTVAEREVITLGSAEAPFWVIQPMNSFEMEHIEEEVRELEKRKAEIFLIAYRVTDWNRELSPWKAPAVFGEQDFGEGAKESLDYILKELLPTFTEKYGEMPDRQYMLAGYSLAGLFALWCGYQTDRFQYVTAVSPSVWFPGWIAYAKEHDMQAKQVYLSLGTKEEKTRNQIMAAVGDCLREQELLLKQGGIPCCLEWNPGNHFMEGPLRMAKGIGFPFINH